MMILAEPQIIVQSDAITAWVGVVGVAVGSALSFFGTARLQRIQQASTSRADRERVIREAESAARDLEAAVELFRTVTALRRTLTGAAGSLIIVAAQVRALRGTAGKPDLITRIGRATTALGGIVAIDGIVDRTLNATSDKYLQIVVPSRQRLVNATVAVRLSWNTEGSAAAERLLVSSEAFADGAMSSSRDYEKAKAEYVKCRQDFHEAVIKS